MTQKTSSIMKNPKLLNGSVTALGHKFVKLLFGLFQVTDKHYSI